MDGIAVSRGGSDRRKVRRFRAWCCGLAIAAVPAVAADKPKVVVVIDEKVAGVFGTTGWETVGQAEATLLSRLSQAGYPVVDAEVVRRNIARDKALKLIEGDDKGAALAGLQFGAQIVVTGQAISKNAGGKLLGTNMQSLQATVQARAVRTDDGKVIAARVGRGSKAHIDEVQGGTLAIEDAAGEVADGLIAALDEASVARRARTAPATRGAVAAAAPGTAGPNGGATEVTMTISGLVSYRHLAFVQQYLAQVRGMQQIRLRQFAGGSAELALDYAGDSPELAATIANQPFTGFRLEPTSVTPNRLDLRAVLQR